MEIRDLLVECGINPANKGFRYLREAIKIRIDDKDIKLVRGIFVRVAMLYGTNYSAVERCCRLALRRAAQRHGTSKAAALLGQKPPKDSYTTYDFIALAALAASKGTPRPLVAVGF